MQLTSRIFDHDGGRRVTVCLPADRPTAVVYSGDGQLVTGWAGALEQAGGPPTALVAVDRTEDPDEMVRIGEYSPTIDPPRFEAHERLLVTEVRDWARAEFDLDLPPARTCAAGVSAGAELALALGLRHPDLFGVVFAASPGAGFAPPDPSELTAPIPRTLLAAGLAEPFFLANARRWAGALADAGAEVELREVPGEHGGPFWRDEFIRMIGSTLGS